MTEPDRSPGAADARPHGDRPAEERTGGSHQRRLFSLPGKTAAVILVAVTITGAGGSVAAALGASPWQVLIASLVVGAPAAVLLARGFWRPLLEVVRALRDGVDSLQAGDLSLRLRAERDDELGDLLSIYNRLADALGDERRELRQREMLLATVLESSPLAILLVSAADRIILSNRAARRLFTHGRRLNGRRFTEILDDCPEEIRQALSSGQDNLVTVRPETGSAEQTYHVTRRLFTLNGRGHALCLVRHMTPELQRKEAAIWKRVIRVISHELNNSLAPLSSLMHSGRLILERSGPSPSGRIDQHERLEEVFDTVDASLERLHGFISGYARFARLPHPRPEQVQLGSFLEHLRNLEPFEIDGELPAVVATFDPGQVQRLLINLVRNAREAGSPPDEIRLAAHVVDDGSLVLILRDRGQGMDDVAIEHATLPFYSSKKGGVGLGLALCREILEAHGGSLGLSSRPGGGVEVVCRLPTGR